MISAGMELAKRCCVVSLCALWWDVCSFLLICRTRFSASVYFNAATDVFAST